MNNICPNCGYEKVPEDWNYQYCSDCREKIESEDDWFR